MEGKIYRIENVNIKDLINLLLDASNVASEVTLIVDSDNNNIYLELPSYVSNEDEEKLFIESLKNNQVPLNEVVVTDELLAMLHTR